MTTSRWLGTVTALFALAGLLGVGVHPAAAQAPFEYTAKFICGRADGDLVQAVAKGRYYTAINVRNTTREPIRLLKQISIALPFERGGPVSRPFDARLEPQQALEIDCPDIFGHTDGIASEPSFLRFFRKGFVTIMSDVPLDVVAVYTTARVNWTGSTGQIQTMAIDRVPARTRDSLRAGARR